MAFTPAVVREFGEIIGTGDAPSITGGVIEKLQGRVGLEPLYFQKQAYMLSPMSMVLTASERKANIDGDRFRKIAGGTYGTIWRNESGMGPVYKRMWRQSKIRAANTPSVRARKEKDNEDFYREAYIEAFIQVVLQNDPVEGGRVSHITGMYRDEAGRRRGTRRTATKTFRASSEPERTVLYYLMEPLPTSFNDYIRSLPQPISMDVAAPIFAAIGRALARFDSEYGFHHCDLHTGNIMFNAAGSPIIIDFGKSCMTVGDRTYAKNDKVCEGFDVMLLMSSIKEYYYGLFTRDVQLMISYFLRDATLDIFHMLATAHAAHQEQRAITHYLYHETSIDLRGTPAGYPWSSPVAGAPGTTVYDLFMASELPLRAQPAHFAAVWANPAAPPPPILPPLPASSSATSSTNTLTP